MATEVSRKRQSSTDQGEDGRVIKHRASKACQACRMRKVRCDVLVNASRCTNCRLDDLECIVLASRRGQNKRRQSKHLNSIRPANPTDIVHESNDAATATEDTWTVPDRAVGSVPVCVTFDDDPGNEKNDDKENDGGQQPSVGRNSATNASPSTPYGGLLTPDTRPDQGLHSGERAPLPSFITPPSSHVLSEDLEYLARKGALTVPEPDLQVEILRSYLFSVHPFMPMLDYRAFVHAVLTDSQDKRVSLLLFQAVMFAGLHSLEPAIVHRLGFESAKQARVVLFNRVRLLYEFDVEPDVAAVLQSLILMSSWYSKWDARRDTWHWTGLAYDVARRMGLHREPSARFASEKARRFRRRLWWSLYIRDRMIALGTRRPLRIYDTDCDVGMLTLDDFDLEPFNGSYQGRPLMPGAKENEATAIMCIQLAKLCICVGRVVSSQYTTLRTQHDQDIPHAVMVLSRRDEGRAEELESCDRQLTDWFEELSTKDHPVIFQSVRTNKAQSCSEVHWAILNMTYQTTVNVLHRTQALQPDSHSPTTAQDSSKSKVKRSARDLTKLSQSMLRRDQLRFVGLIGVTAIIAAYLSHILDITSAENDDNDDVRDASTFRLYQSLEVLQSFRSIYASADAAVSFLTSVSRKAGISVPMQATGTAVGLPSTTTTSALPAPSKKPPIGLQRGQRVQGDVQTTGWQSSAVGIPSANSRQQQQQQNQQPFGIDEQISNSLTARPSIFADTFATSSKNAQTSNEGTVTTPANQYGSAYSIDASLGGLSSYTGDGTAFFDWGDGIDSRGNSLDLGLVSFDHDFYIDTFGFTDTRFQGA